MKIKAKVLAIRALDFKDDNDEPIKGYQTFVSAETDQPGWTQNIEVMKCWTADSSNMAATVASLIPGDEVYVEFNRRGKPVIVELV